MELGFPDDSFAILTVSCLTFLSLKFLATSIMGNLSNLNDHDKTESAAKIVSSVHAVVAIFANLCVIILDSNLWGVRTSYSSPRQVVVVAISCGYFL